MLLNLISIINQQVIQKITPPIFLCVNASLNKLKNLIKDAVTQPIPITLKASLD
jgi:hypothetical protein